MLGILGWYVTTIGTLLVAFLGRGANVSSLVFNLALLICFKTNAFLTSAALALLRKMQESHQRRTLHGISKTQEPGGLLSTR